MATPLWERSKENAAPLERGRSLQKLEKALESSDRSKHEQELQLHERLVRPSEAEDYEDGTDEDPLIPWLSYIKFHQDSFPSDKHGEFLLLERCFRALAKHSRYANDVRFVRVCCKYADQTERPLEVFQYLYQQKIGGDLALFWMVWAFVAEKQEDYRLAQKIFDKGLRREAQPLNKLQERHRQFQRRMSRYWLNATTDEDDEKGGRGVLGGLSEDNVRRNQRAPRGPTSTFSVRSNNSRGSQNSNNRANGFAIFVDENNENDASFMDRPVAIDRTLEREQDRKKENTLAAESWNQRGAYVPAYSGSKHRSSSSSQAAFAVHVDEGCLIQHEQQAHAQREHENRHRRTRDERTFQERSALSVGEQLSKDPLRYVRDPSQLQSDRRVQPLQPQKPQAKKKGPSKPAYNTALLKDAQGREQSFEEARAAASCYQFTQLPVINLLQTVVTPNDSAMSLDESMDTSMVSKNDSAASHPGMPPPRPLADVRVCQSSLDGSQATPRNLSSASSTVDEAHAVGAKNAEPTINTQLAMKELSMMFSSPAEASFRINSSFASDTGSVVLPHSLVKKDARLGTIVDEDSRESNTGLNASAFPIFQDASKSPAQHQPSQGGFAIFRDGTENEAVSAPTAAPAFQIFDDSGTAAPSSSANRELRFAKGEVTNPDDTSGDSATSSMFGDVMETLNDKVTVKSASPNGEETAGLTEGFQIFVDSENRPPSTKSADGDTATFSVFGDVMDVLQVGGVGGDGSPDSDTVTLELRKMHIRDSTSNTPPAVKRIRMSSEGPDFGDISRIVQAEDTVAFASREDHAVEYRCLHMADMKGARLVIQKRASSLSSLDKSLAKLLGSQTIVALPTHVVPRSLKRKQLASGSDIRFGRCHGEVKVELGRGSYGVVALVSGDEGDDIAVKSQAPVECLAWEYVVLERLRDRTLSFFERTGKRYPYPRPLAFVNLADGALLSMTAASGSGLNLVDLVNVYKVATGKAVPELVALHYTSRMLHHLEHLHWHGQILVRPRRRTLRITEHNS